MNLDLDMRKNLLVTQRCQPVGDDGQNVGFNESHDQISLVIKFNRRGFLIVNFTFVESQTKLYKWGLFLIRCLPKTPVNNILYTFIR